MTTEKIKIILNRTINNDKILFRVRMMSLFLYYEIKVKYKSWFNIKIIPDIDACYYNIDKSMIIYNTYDQIISDIANDRIKQLMKNNKTEYLFMADNCTEQSIIKSFTRYTGLNYSDFPPILPPDIIIEYNYTWQFKYYKDVWKPSTTQIYADNMQRLQIALHLSTDEFQHEYFCDDGNYAIVISYLEKTGFKPSTIELYLKSIITYLRYFCDAPLTIIAKYTLIYNSYNSVITDKIEVPNFPDVIEIINGLSYIDPIFKIIFLIYTYGFNSGKEIGILRFSDMINTKTSYCDEYNYICKDTCSYVIKKKYTKNSKDRIIKLDPEFITYYDKLNADGEWLLLYSPDSAKLAQPTLSTQLKDYTGYNLNLLRGSIETYALNNFTKENSERISANMGHLFKTVVKYYYRP